MAKQNYKSPTDAGAAWQGGVSAGGANYSKGVAGTSDWAGPAIAAKARRDAGLQAAIANGTIDAGIQRTGTQGWKAAATGKGAANFQARASSARPKYEQGYSQKLLPALQAGQAAIAGMDASSQAGRLQRMVTYVTKVSEVTQQQKRGG